MSSRNFRDKPPSSCITSCIARRVSASASRHAEAPIAAPAVTRTRPPLGCTPSRAGYRRG